MNVYRRWMQAVLGALLLVLLLAAWVIFAPLQLGGQASYVVVNGRSMEPLFHYNDFIIIHQAAAFNVGDVVTYYSPELNSFVLHRIIGVNLDRFVLKGDNNGWTDSYQPSRDELIGKYWITIPNAGNIIKWLRTPVVMAVTVGSLALILVVVITSRPKRGRTMNKKLSFGWFASVRGWVRRNFPGRITDFSLRRVFRSKQPAELAISSASPAGPPGQPRPEPLRKIGGHV